MHGGLAAMPRKFFHPVVRTAFACQQCLLIGALVIASDKGAAADDVTKDSAIPYAGPATDHWNGFYAGGHLGYAWGSSNWTASSLGAPSVSGSFSLAQPIDVFSNTGSFFEGLQAGYNYMLPNRLLIGAEVDASFPSFPNLA